MLSTVMFVIEVGNSGSIQKSEMRAPNRSMAVGSISTASPTVEIS